MGEFLIVHRFLKFLLSLSLLLCVVVPAWADVPRVVVSIKPIHALVSGVMQGVARPHLLISGHASPHAYVLRPSDVRRLHRADLLFWVGAELETFLVRVLETLPVEVKQVVVLASPDIQRWPNREVGLENDASSVLMPPPSARHQHGHWDPHVWLDPNNARAIVRLAGRVLTQQFPSFAEKFQANVVRMLHRLERLDQEIKQQMMPVGAGSFLVYHDAYQYLERHLGVRASGSITLNPGQPLGARRIGTLRRFLADSPVACLFVEPQFRAAIVETIVEGHAVRVKMLDPLGMHLEEGEAHYFELLRGLTHTLTECLQSTPRPGDRG